MSIFLTLLILIFGDSTHHSRFLSSCSKPYTRFLFLLGRFLNRRSATTVSILAWSVIGIRTFKAWSIYPFPAFAFAFVFFGSTFTGSSPSGENFSPDAAAARLSPAFSTIASCSSSSHAVSKASFSACSLSFCIKS